MHDPFPSPPRAAVALITPFAQSIGLSTLPFHIHEIVLAFLLYNCIYIIVAPIVSRRLAPATYPTLLRRTQIDWDVRVVSQVQSLLILCCAFYLIATDPQRFNTDWRERLWGYNGATGFVQAMAAGYFLWDVQVSAQHFDVLGVGSLMHACGALAVTFAGFRPFANYYGLNFILYEISTPFLNAHWWLDKVGMTGTMTQLVNGIVLITTFGCARLVWGTYQSVLIYRDLWTAWTFGLSADNANIHPMPKSAAADTIEIGGNTSVLPLWLAILYLGSNTVLSLLNLYWFSRMVAAVRKRFGRNQADEIGRRKNK